MGGHSWKYTRWYLREAMAAALFLSAVAIGLYVNFSNRSSFHRELTITGGSASGSRAQIALSLAGEAKKQGLKLKVIDSEGSKQALERVDRGLLDMALVQGGLDPAAYIHVRQLAALHIEPLHLLVKPELHRAVLENFASLRGTTVNLSTPGSGTHDLALEVLRFAGMKPRRPDGSGDYQASTASYEELLKMDRGNLPDAVFTVSDLPSPIVRHLAAKHHYQLVPLRFGEAFSLSSFGDERQKKGPPRDDADDVTKFRIYPTVIPAYTYGIESPSPPTPLATFGPRLLLVAHESIPTQAVRLVLETIFSTNFAQYYRPPLDPSLLDLAPEYPWHVGTDEYRDYHKPLRAGQVVDLMEKATSLTGAVVGALFFLGWQT